MFPLKFIYAAEAPSDALTLSELQAELSARNVTATRLGTLPTSGTVATADDLSGLSTFDHTSDNITGSVGGVAGDVTGKVLGGGSGTITGVGAWGDVRLWMGDPADRTAQAGTTTSITLASAESAADDALIGWLVWLADGTGANQLALVTDYVGSNRVATVVDFRTGNALATAPDDTTIYQLIPPANAPKVPTVAEFEARTLPAADYFDPANDTVASVTAVGSVSGSVGSVTGNVGGNVTGSVGSISGVTFPSNFGTLGINASGHISRVTLVDTTTTNTDMRGTDSAYTGTPPTAGTIADAVWDETLADHLAAGSTGAGLNAAGSAGDPWTTTLPGSYTGAQAGKILADVLVDTGATLPATLADMQGATFDTATDSLEAIRNRGDAAWTGSGGGLTAEDVWSHGTRTLSANTNLNDPTAAAIASQVRTELATELARIDAAVSTRSTLDAAGVRSAVGLSSADLGTRLDDLPTVAEFEARTIPATDYFDASTDSVTVGTNSDKTGYSLAPTGLDSIPITAPSGVASNFREMIVQTWRRFFKRATKTDSQLITYADDGTTAITTQAISDDGTTEVQGAAS